MVPIPDDVAGLIGRLFLAGPIGYVGLWVAMNPARTIRLVHDLGVGIHRFRDQLRWSQWRQPLFEQQPVLDSPSARLFIRLLGATLTVFSLLVIAGIGR